MARGGQSDHAVVNCTVSHASRAHTARFDTPQADGPAHRPRRVRKGLKCSHTPRRLTKRGSPRRMLSGVWAWGRCPSVCSAFSRERRPREPRGSLSQPRSPSRTDARRTCSHCLQPKHDTLESVVRDRLAPTPLCMLLSSPTAGSTHSQRASRLASEFLKAHRVRPSDPSTSVHLLFPNLPFLSISAIAPCLSVPHRPHPARMPACAPVCCRMHGPSSLGSPHARRTLDARRPPVNQICRHPALQPWEDQAAVLFPLRHPISPPHQETATVRPSVDFHAADICRGPTLCGRQETHNRSSRNAYQVSFHHPPSPHPQSADAVTL